MSDAERAQAGFFDLDDQEFLKEMGISAMPSGAEFMLRMARETREAKTRIEERADGLQTLELNEHALEAMSLETGEDIEVLREKLRLFRDAT